MSEQSGYITEPSPSSKQQQMICSVVSRENDEQLFGTVSQTDTWLLLQYPEPMGSKAFEESSIPPDVKEHLNSLLDSVPYSRLLVIRQKKASQSGGITLFVALTRESEPVLYEFHLADYPDLLRLDMRAVLRQEPVYQGNLRQEPLYLVCTNGRRDPCCARWGLPVYLDLAQVAGRNVWESSHVGGHRFAANVLYFPQGIYYGRIHSDEIQSLLEAHQQRQVYLDKYRGRACYSPVAQAAEFFLRSQTGERHMDAYRLLEAAEASPDQWEVRFVETEMGKKYRLQIQSGLSEYQVYDGCKSDTPGPQTQYRLIEINTSL